MNQTTTQRVQKRKQFRNELNTLIFEFLELFDQIIKGDIPTIAHTYPKIQSKYEQISDLIDNSPTKLDWIKRNNILNDRFEFTYLIAKKLKLWGTY